MAKKKETREEKSAKEKYEGFIEAFDSLQGASQSSQNLHSEDIGARESARRYAIDYADENMEGLEGIAKNPTAQASVLNSDASVDRILGNAINKYQLLTKKRFESSSDEIIQETPDKGLAKIVYMTPAIKIEGNERHNKAAYLHGAYAQLNGLITSDEHEGEEGVKKVKHEDFYKTLVPYIVEKIKKKFDEDEELKGEKKLLENTLAASAFVLASSPQACIMAARNYAGKYKKEFEEHLPGDSDKARYARETLRVISKDDKLRPHAMELVYKAHKVAA